MTAVRFHIHPHLLETLGQQYPSTEKALRELVVNAWDADARLVRISLPMPMTDDPIVVEDDGLGMATGQIEEQFFTIGVDRRKTRGELSLSGRLVRGSKGIGRFAGLEVAERMTVETTWSGRTSRFTLNRTAIESMDDTLESSPFDIEVEESGRPNGTRITLSGLRQRLSFPDPGRLTRVLLQEFGLASGFDIEVNDRRLTSDDLPVAPEPMTVILPTGNQISGRIWMLDRSNAVREPGIVLRVQGRAVGPPTYLGLDGDPDVPASLRRRLYAEFDVDELGPDVLSNWDGFVENSTAYQEVTQAIRGTVKEVLVRQVAAEGGVDETEFVESYREQIEKLPRPRRELARAALLRVFKRFYDEVAEQKHAVADLVLDAFEQDEYWVLVRRIQETSGADIEELAGHLESWGLYEVNGIITRARQRLEILDGFEDLIRNDDTLELSGVHQALKDNLWLLDDRYELLKSNTTLANIVKDTFGKKYQGSRSRRRPDLLLAGLQDRYLIVEFKRPSESIDRQNIAQGETYRDELGTHLPGGYFDVVIIGGRVDPPLLRDPTPTVTVTTYRQVLLEARRRLEWLIQHIDV